MDANALMQLFQSQKQPMQGAPDAGAGGYAPNAGAGTPQPSVMDSILDYYRQRKMMAQQEDALKQQALVAEATKRAEMQEMQRRQQMTGNIDQVMAQQQGPQPQMPAQPQGPLSRMEGGNPNQIQMNPQDIEALRRAGAL